MNLNIKEWSQVEYLNQMLINLWVLEHLKMQKLKHLKTQICSFGHQTLLIIKNMGKKNLANMDQYFVMADPV